MAKPRTTKTVRMAIDLELEHPRDAFALKDLSIVIDSVVGELKSVYKARVTEIIPAEPDFDWQGQ